MAIVAHKHNTFKELGIGCESILQGIWNCKHFNSMDSSATFNPKASGSNPKHTIFAFSEFC